MRNKAPPGQSKRKGGGGVGGANGPSGSGNPAVRACSSAGNDAGAAGAAPGSVNSTSFSSSSCGQFQQHHLNGRKGDDVHVCNIAFNEGDPALQAYMLIDKFAVFCGLYVSDQLDMAMELALLAYSVAHLLVQNYNVYRTHYLEVDYCAFTFSLLALVRRVAWKSVQQAYYDYLVHGARLPASYLPVSHLNATAHRYAYTHNTNFHQSPLNVALPHAGREGKGGHDTSWIPWRVGGRDPAGKDASGEGEGGRSGLTPLQILVAASVAFGVVMGLSGYFGLLLATRTDRQPGKMLLLGAPILLYCTSVDRLSKCLPEKCVYLSGAKGGLKAPSQALFLSSRSFPLLLKNILYTSLTNALYVGIFPAVFVSSDHLYWHPHRTRLVVFVVFVNTFLLLASRLLALRVHELLSSVHTFGCWRPCPREGCTIPSDPKDVPVWKPALLYKRKAMVRFHPGLVPSAAKADSSSVKVDDTILMQATVYRGVGCRNASIPGDFSMTVAWRLFSAPLKTQAMFALCHLVLALGLLLVSLYSVTWCPSCVMVASTYALLYIALKTKKRCKADERLRALSQRLDPPEA